MHCVVYSVFYMCHIFHNNYYWKVIMNSSVKKYHYYLKLVYDVFCLPLQQGNFYSYMIIFIVLPSSTCFHSVFLPACLLSVSGVEGDFLLGWRSEKLLTWKVIPVETWLEMSPTLMVILMRYQQHFDKVFRATKCFFCNCGNDDHNDKIILILTCE